MTDATDSDVSSSLVSQVRLVSAETHRGCRSNRHVSQDDALHLHTDLGLGTSRVPDSTVLTCFNASRALGMSRRPR